MESGESINNQQLSGKSINKGLKTNKSKKNGDDTSKNKHHETDNNQHSLMHAERKHMTGSTYLALVQSAHHCHLLHCDRLMVCCCGPAAHFDFIIVSISIIIFSGHMQCTVYVSGLTSCCGAYLGHCCRHHHCCHHCHHHCSPHGLLLCCACGLLRFTLVKSM